MEKFLKSEYGTDLVKVDKFDNPNVLAQFDPNANVIKYQEGATEYLIAHESYHAMEMKNLGFTEYVKDAALKGTKFPDGFTPENWQRLYKREKFVLDKILENADIHGLNLDEIFHAKWYLRTIEFDMIAKNIEIPK